MQGWTPKLPSLGCPSLRPSLQGSPIGLFFFYFFFYYFFKKSFIYTGEYRIGVDTCVSVSMSLPASLCDVHRYLGRYLAPSLRPNFLRVRSQAKVELTASDWLNES